IALSFVRSRPRRALPPFPTRRSSDLAAGGKIDPAQIHVADLARAHGDPLLARVRKLLRADHGFTRHEGKKFRVDCVFSPEPLRRSEEHTSELQSRENLVCRLLLEKKK